MSEKIGAKEAQVRALREARAERVTKAKVTIDKAVKVMQSVKMKPKKRKAKR